MDNAHPKATRKEVHVSRRGEGGEGEGAKSADVERNQLIHARVYVQRNGN